MLKDLSAFLKALVPEEGFRSLNGKGELISYLHCDEGPDDMPAHIRTALTSTCLSLSVISSKLTLGIRQAIYLLEHREQKQIRKICLHAIGELEE